MSPNSAAVKLNAIVSLCTDVLLLLIMLIGLLRWRLKQGGTSSLTRFLWTQGLIWILLATIAYVPPIVFLSLNLNAAFDMMLQTPALITLSIAATRMYRSLVDFGSRDITISTQKRRGHTASDGNRTRVGPIQFNQMSVSINEDGE